MTDEPERGTPADIVAKLRYLANLDLRDAEWSAEIIKARAVMSLAADLIESLLDVDAMTEKPSKAAVSLAMQAGSWFDRKDLTLPQRERPQ